MPLNYNVLVTWYVCIVSDASTQRNKSFDSIIYYLYNIETSVKTMKIIVDLLSPPPYNW